MATLGEWDVAIVGGGIFGLACACACARKGRTSIVLERDAVGSGASGGPVGALAPFSPRPWTPLKQFQFDGLVSAAAYWEGVDGEAGTASGYGRVGRIVPLSSEQARERALISASAAESHWGGQFSMSIEPGDGILAGSGHGRFGVVRDTLSARIGPMAACLALRQVARNLGTEILEHCEVVGAEPGGVLTEAGEIRSGATVLAAGADTFRLLDNTVPEILGGGIKGQAALVEYDLRGAPVIQAGRIFVVPHANGTVGIGSTRETEWDDRFGTDERLDDVIDEACSIVPALRNARLLRRWAGLRPRAIRSNPLVGPVPGRRGLYVATGGHGIGFSIAHMVGEIVAAMILGLPHDLPPEFTP